MSVLHRRDPRTATPTNSIWHDIPEIRFREHVVALEQCTNAVPIAPVTFPLTDRLASGDIGPDGTERLLPLATEQCLADDIACIVAVGQGAQSVAAVCVEEHIDRQGLTLRIAAIDAIDETLRRVLLEITSYLSDTCTSSAAGDAQHVFGLILVQHRARILGRLRSVKWEKPQYLSRSHKKPLWQDFDNLIHRVQFLFTKRESQSRNEIEARLKDLASIYQAFEETEAGSEDENCGLQRLIRSSHSFCLSTPGRLYAQRLQSLPKVTGQSASAIKCLQQVEKLAAYWRIAIDLVEWSRTFPSLFQKVTLAFVLPYTPTATTVGYESWAKLCHVHAEVQLAVFYDLELQGMHHTFPSTIAETCLPRCIGTSKYLCYLCYLFLTHRNKSQALSVIGAIHHDLQVSNTHGRLYDQWTIPDLAEFDLNIVRTYRDIIREMDQEIRALTSHIVAELEQEQLNLGEGRGNGKSRTADGKLVKWRTEPMTSREDLLLVENEIV